MKIDVVLGGGPWVLHGCGSRHVESIPFYKRFQNKQPAMVTSKSSIDSAATRRRYAWQYRQVDETIRTVVLLELPPVDSLLSAAKAAVSTGLS
jgi:hypothetical protein